MRRQSTLGMALLVAAILPACVRAQGTPDFVPVLPVGPPNSQNAPVFVPVPAEPPGSEAVTAPSPQGSVTAAPFTDTTEAIAPPVPLPPPPPRVPVKKGFLARHGLCCWTTHYTLGCSSLKSECKFIFGSCRTFYGEPCLGAPPPALRPPGYTLPLRSGCPCEQ